MASFALLGALCGCSIQSRSDPTEQWGIGGYAAASAAAEGVGAAANATTALLPELTGPPSGQTPGGLAATNVAPWEFELIPYFWLPSMHGTVGVKGKTAPVDLSSREVLDLLRDTMDWGAATRMELRKGRWGLLADLAYLKGEERVHAPGGHLAIDTKYSSAIAELAGAYRVLDRPRMVGAAEALPVWSPQSVDMLAGARYTRLGGDVTGTLTSGTLTLSQSQSSTEEWLDPFIGARGGWRLLDKLDLNLRGDVGGFGVGSEFAWNLDASLKYHLSRRVELMGGYRTLDYDYHNEGFRFDVRMAGPWVGCGISF